MNYRVTRRFALTLIALLLEAACGGGHGDPPLTDAGGPADAAPDGGPAPAWPVPSVFPVDSPVQLGEGDACRLSIQCTDFRQICVDDACIREERVRVEDLTLGAWRILTPESTDENPLATLTDVMLVGQTTLDEDGEVALAGQARDSAGRTVLFSVGQDVRLVTPVDGDVVYLLPFRDGFLTYNGETTVAFLGVDGVTQWTATVRGSPRAPYDVSGVIGFGRPLVHTPIGPVVAMIMSVDGGLTYDIIELQRLDLAAHRFVDVDFVDGPYVVGASIGQAIMGPTGLELILGRAEGDAQPLLSVYSVATGAERSIGTGILPWDVEVTSLASDDWVAAFYRDQLADGCESVAFGSNGAEIARYPGVVPGHCTGFSAWRPRSVERYGVPVYLKNRNRSAWFATDPSSGSNAIAESVDGRVWETLGVGTGLERAASRYGKTWEALGAYVGAGVVPGVYFAERALVSNPGGG